MSKYQLGESRQAIIRKLSNILAAVVLDASIVEWWADLRWQQRGRFQNGRNFPEAIRDPGDDRGGSGSTGATSKAPPPEKIAPGDKPLSARLSDEFAMQRRDILAAAVLADPATWWRGSRASARSMTPARPPGWR